MGEEPVSDDTSRGQTDIAATGSVKTVTPGVGMSKPWLGGVLALTIGGALIVGLAARWNVLAILISLILGAMIIVGVARHSQRDLLQFKREHRRWPREDELDAWNEEMQGRRHKAQRVATAAGGAKSAENSYRKRVADADRTLQAAQRQHQAAIANAGAGLAAAEKAHAAAVAHAMGNLEAWRNPGRGNHIATFKGLRLYQHAIGRGNRFAPILSAQATVAGNVLMVHSGVFQDLTKLTSGEMMAAHQFGSRLIAAVNAEVAFEHQRPSAIGACEQYYAQVTADTALIVAARATAIQAQTDPELLAAIREAGTALASARADTAAMDAAGAELETHRQSSVEPLSTTAPPTWAPRAANAGLAAIGIAVMTVLVGGTSAVATAYPLRSSASNQPAIASRVTVSASTPAATGALTPTPSATTAPTPTTAAAAAALTDSQKAQVRTILTANIDHYANAFRDGQSALGTTQYANAQAGLAAFDDPNSGASKFRDWRGTSKVETDVSYLSAFSQADAFYSAANEPPAIGDWRNDMSDLQVAITDWVQVAVSWEIKSVSNAELAGAAGKVETDIAKSRAGVQLVLLYAAPAPTPTPAPTTPPTSSSVATGPVIGFGASDATWNAHHTADPDFAPGAVYDADPSLPKINGHTGARYVVVQHSHGHVLGYNMNLHAGTSVDAAKTAALQEFPSDAVVLWFNVKSSCAQMEIQSAALGRELNDPSIGDPEGMAVIELDTERDNGTATYDPNNINELILTLGSYKQVSEAPAC